MPKDIDEIHISLQAIAYKLTFNRLDTALQIWWSHFYKRPIFHETIGEYTMEEMLLEWNIHKMFADDNFRRECESRITQGKDFDDEEWIKQELGIDYFKDVLNIDDETAIKKLANEINKDGGEIHESFSKG